MLSKILIANRGEIACRIAQTARVMGIKTVGVYSEADRHAKHTQVMDESYFIGPPAPAQSYLKVDRILDIAKKTGAQAIHPGYGFLSENAGFVKTLNDNGIEFIGPPASAIQSMGSKSESKHIMENANVPIVKGYHGDNQDPQFLLEQAKKIEFPVMLKASLGGGGKGMRIVWSEKEFFEQLEAAKREAMKGFSDDHMLIEKYIEKPRHIEVQVFGDKLGNYVHLNERDCSVQRRHQKVVEEAPSAISSQLRSEIGEAAIKAAKAVGYYNAGTVEFIFDTMSDKFYFMEMNTRLQVEHPVTEWVTGQDLVEWQLKVASGMPLPIKDQSKIPLFGHSIEARIYSEDPVNNFLPGSGKIKVLREPVQTDKVRIDTGVRQGDEISTFYDPMISKLIVRGPDRESAIQTLYTALDDYKIVGLPTNIQFVKKVLLNQDFRSWDYDTSFIANNEEELIGARSNYSLHVTDSNRIHYMAQVAVANMWLQMQEKNSAADPWGIRDNFRLNLPSLQKVDFDFLDKEGETGSVHIQFNSGSNFTVYKYDALNDKKEVLLENVTVSINPENSGEILLRSSESQQKVQFLRNDHDGVTHFYDSEGIPFPFEIKEEDLLGQDGDGPGTASDVVKSPMPGTVVKVFVKPGQAVKADDPVISVESMKMEFLIRATHDAVVKEVRAGEAQFVEMGAVLVTYEPTEEE